MSELPRGIGQPLRVRDLKPGMTVALKQPGEPFMVVEVHTVHRLAVVFTALDDKLILPRAGDELDSVLSLDAMTETHMFEYHAE